MKSFAATLAHSWLKTFVFIVAAVGILGLPACGPSGESKSHQSLYDRVMNSGKLRASYADYPPYCIKDPNTGKLSGIFVEVLNEAGKRLGIKVEWVEEVGWGAIFEGLKSNRHDIFGAGIWRNSARSKVGDFSHPLFYNVILAYGRTDESRFIESVDGMNNPEVRFATLDGAIQDIIASADFPAAKKVSVSQLNPASDLLLNITSNKADVTVAEPSMVNLYLEKNPGTLKVLAGGRPIRVFANTYAFNRGEPEFKAMLDGTLEEMLNDGTIEKILRKYEKHPGEIWRIAPPYLEPKQRAGNA